MKNDCFSDRSQHAQLKSRISSVFNTKWCGASLKGYGRPVNVTCNGKRTKMQTEFVIALDKDLAQFVNIFTPRMAEPMVQPDGGTGEVMQFLTQLKNCYTCTKRACLQEEEIDDLVKIAMSHQGDSTRRDWMNLDDLNLAFQYMSI